jgi:hypothetical protein
MSYITTEYERRSINEVIWLHDRRFILNVLHYLVQYYIRSTALCGAETWNSSGSGSEIAGKF